MLRKVEQALQAAIEKPFSRLFPEKLQPAEIKARLREALEGARNVTPEGASAANRYLVEMNLEDYRAIEAVGPALERELLQYLQECATDSRVTIGPYASVSVSANEAVPAGELRVQAQFSDRPPAHLQVEAGLRRRDKRVPLHERNVIGRSNECDIVIGDEAVSRRHCEIVWLAVQYVVHDLHSANGTFVNGQQVQSAPLREGDLLEVGLVQLRFHDG